MKLDDLELLDEAVRLLLSRDGVRDAIAELKASLPRSEEPFVWTVLDLDTLALARIDAPLRDFPVGLASELILWNNGVTSLP